MTDPFFDAQDCARCGASLRVRMMSRFNTDTLCMACIADEKLAPGYQAAHDAELAAIKNGDFNYNHGLGPADQTFLAKRRRLRKESV